MKSRVNVMSVDCKNPFGCLREVRSDDATIDLVPALANPKDLFALLGARRVTPRAVHGVRVPA